MSFIKAWMSNLWSILQGATIIVGLFVGTIVGSYWILAGLAGLANNFKSKGIPVPDWTAFALISFGIVVIASLLLTVKGRRQK